jgi:hypothetical protein
MLLNYEVMPLSEKQLKDRETAPPRTVPMRRYVKPVNGKLVEYSTGRGSRKTAVAHVCISPGQGRIMVNNRLHTEVCLLLVLNFFP